MLPAIFGAIGAVTKLFDVGKDIYETVTGKPSAATTTDELKDEVEALPTDQQQAWAATMSAKIEMYRAETDRIANEQGEVTEGILSTLPPEAAAKVAILRMTTRPWAVRQMVRVILLPIYVIAIDGVIALYNILSEAFFNGKQLGFLAERFAGGDSVYMQLYTWAAPTAATVVITYMTARAVEKAKGHAGDMKISDVVSTAGQAFAGIKKLIGR